MTVQELADSVGGRIEGGDPDAAITGVASIAEARAGDITFLGNRKYAGLLGNCNATALLLAEGESAEFGGARIFVENPTHAFAKVIDQFAPPPVIFSPGVHASAVVADGVTLGQNVSIQPGAVIEAGASIGDRSVIGANSYVGQEVRIGEDCLIYPNVTIRERCILGDRVILHSSAVIGSDGFGFELVKGRHAKIPQVGIVQIDNDVEVGSNTSIDRARFGRTWIQEGVKIDNLVQVAHNVVVGRHSLLVSQTGISGSCQLGEYVTFAGQSGMAGHLRVGDRAIIAGRGGVISDVPDGAVMWGMPAVPMREEKENLINIRRLSKLTKRVKRLEQLLEERSGEAGGGGGDENE